MKIFSSPEKDVRSRAHQPGGYEWWYFDAVSVDDKYSFAVIFYEGNPFSTRYIKALEDMQGLQPMPHEYPAVSISIYEDETPLYYSFTEFEQSDSEFSEDLPYVKIGPHRMESEISDNQLIYELKLEERLPSGDQLEARLTFESPDSGMLLFDEQTTDDSVGHLWNLVQPQADVSGEIQLLSGGEITQVIAFEGKGYHDQNTGPEPMQNEFTDWYWGRFHFDYATLVYFVMNHRDSEQHQGWLISKDNAKLLDTFDKIALEDKGLTVFGLKTSRKISLKSQRTEVTIQQSRLLDNGPFYRRYLSDAFLRIAGEGIVESQSGIGEYIRPDRIHKRIFWPFVNMRIRYKSEKPHWVQKSKTLYRWTW